MDEEILAEAWHSYRRLKNTAIIMLVLFLASIAIVMTNIAKTDLVYPLPIVFGLVLMVVLARARDWKCPRCGNTFFSSKNYRNVFAQKCVHCGLTKYAKSEPKE